MWDINNTQPWDIKLKHIYSCFFSIAFYKTIAYIKMYLNVFNYINSKFQTLWNRKLFLIVQRESCICSFFYVLNVLWPTKHFPAQSKLLIFFFTHMIYSYPLRKALIFQHSWCWLRYVFGFAFHIPFIRCSFCSLTTFTCVVSPYHCAQPYPEYSGNAVC